MNAFVCLNKVYMYIPKYKTKKGVWIWILTMNAKRIKPSVIKAYANKAGQSHDYPKYKNKMNTRLGTISTYGPWDLGISF